MRHLLALLLATAAAIHAGLAVAWGGDGHRIVCAIAWDEMRPATRDRVQQLLGVEGRKALLNDSTP